MVLPLTLMSMSISDPDFSFSCHTKQFRSKPVKYFNNYNLNADNNYIGLFNVPEFISFLSMDFNFMEENNMEQKYRNLWAAVLKQAIKDANQNTKYPFNNPQLWFKSDSHAVGSFLWICNILNIDPESIRFPLEIGIKRAA